MKCSVSNRRVDGGYGWLVVFTSFFIQMVIDGILYSFGNLLIELLDEFGEDISLTAIIVSLLHGILNITGPFAAVRCDRYGYRVVSISGAVISCVGFILSTFATSIYYLYVTYGFMGGVGFGLSYLSVNVCVIKHFKKYRGLAIGIASCGSGAGTFALTNLTRYLIDFYGWRGCVLIEAGLCLQCLVFIPFLLPPIDVKTTDVATHGNTDENDYQNPRREDEENCREHEASLIEQQIEVDRRHSEVKQSRYCISLYSSELLKNKRFLTLLVSTWVVFLAVSIPVTFIADHAVESGMSKQEGAWLASSIGISNAAGRIIFGCLADKRGVNRKVLFVVLLFLAGASTAVSFVLTAFSTRMVYACLFGAFIGGYYSILNLLTADIVETKLVSKSIGLLLFTIGISVSIAAPIGGLLYDLTGNYDVTFIVAGSELIIGGILALLLKPCS